MVETNAKAQSRLAPIAVAAVALLSIVGAAFFSSDEARRAPYVLPSAIGAIGERAATQSEAIAEIQPLTAWLLDGVYVAFSLEEEGEIYNALASRAVGDALEDLYLQRRAALADTGLETAEQTIHEIELLSADARPQGDAIAVDAAWRVVAEVGHDAHKHMRGNGYRAGLTLIQVDERWRVAGFDLRAIDRTDAGLIVEESANDHDSDAAQ